MFGLNLSTCSNDCLWIRLWYHLIKLFARLNSLDLLVKLLYYHYCCCCLTCFKCTYFSSFIIAVWRLHLRLAILAPIPAALQPWNHRVHKNAWCWARHRTLKVPWMGAIKWMRAHTADLHHAAEEGRWKRAHSFCHWKHHVQRDSQEGICDWGDCPRSWGICASWHKWNCIPRICITDHGSSPQRTYHVGRWSDSRWIRIYAHVYICVGQTLGVWRTEWSMSKFFNGC